ncbi:MAG: hypothetical protein NC344_10160 [Bacteroidales bacterium]|nr:hypothetical protein [Bacteroidales bacterium]MCM1148167.1 hypothetical protein [Bacteroidales bacterium]MCM1207106.1 hypothetical protein [Bacillota bacterium]MCM1510858.1 hypothetical protein [Clostridium sp.]
MGVTFDRTIYTGRKQAFWRGEAKMLPGGFHVENRISIGSVIKRGAFIQVDFDNMSCGLVKVGKILEGGTATKPRVAKDNYFEIGDEVVKYGGDALVSVKDIDRSNDAYDIITFDKALTGLVKDDFIVEGVADGEAVKSRYTPNCVVGADKEWKSQGSESLDAAYDVLVIRDNVPEFPKEWVAEEGFHMKTNPQIRFISQ